MKLEIFFDYLCEFCWMGYQNWVTLFPEFPEIEPVWRPCEAHPRTEEPWGIHSDLAIQGLLYLQEHGGNVPVYHDSVFHGVYQHGKDIEDTAFLCRCGEKAGVNPKELKAVLSSGSYRQKQLECNRYAYGTCSVFAVPTYRLENGTRLDSILGVGVSRVQLETLLRATR